MNENHRKILRSYFHGKAIAQHHKKGENARVGRMITLGLIVLEFTANEFTRLGYDRIDIATIAGFVAEYIGRGERSRDQAPIEAATAMRSFAHEIILMAATLEKTDISDIVKNMIDTVNKQPKGKKE